MSRKRKDHNGFKKPSLVTNNNQYGGALPYNGSQSVPMGQDLDVIGDMDEIEVESTYLRYTGSGQLNNNNNNSNNINKSSVTSNRQMHELNDQEPYNRRESYIQDINHEPYWQQEKESGLHPFQTPKSTKNDNTPFFNKNIIHNDNESPIPSINKLVDTPPINTMNQQKSRNSASLSRNSASHSSQTQHSIHSTSTHSNNSHQMGSSEDNLQNTTLTSTNTSLEMVIPEENELIHNMPNNHRNNIDIYGVNDERENITTSAISHNGRITSYVRNGQMNPISLYNNHYSTNIDHNQYSNNDHPHSHSHSHSHHHHHHPHHHHIQEEDSYEDSHSNVVDDIHDVVVGVVGHDDDEEDNNNNNNNNKRIVTNSFLKTTINTNGDKKKVSFGGVQSTVTFDPSSTSKQSKQQQQQQQQQQNDKCQSPLSLSQTSESPSLTSHGSSQAPHLLIQSQTGGSIGLQQSVMATLTPNGQKINQDGNYPYPLMDHNQNEPLVFGANVSKTAPSSPLQKKFKFSPQVSSIKNQRHSVVSIAMIQKIREKKALLDTHNNNGTATPSLSVGSLDEEYDNDDEHMNNINVSYYNNDTHHVIINNNKPSHQVPFIQRSGTEDDILHR